MCVVCVCILHTFVHVHTHVYACGACTHICVRVHACYTRVNACLRTCSCVYVRVCTFLCTVCVHLCVCVHVCANASMCVGMCANAHVCMCMCYMHVCMYVCVHVCVRVCAAWLGKEIAVAQCPWASSFTITCLSRLSGPTASPPHSGHSALRGQWASRRPILSPRWTHRHTSVLAWPGPRAGSRSAHRRSGFCNCRL